MTAPTEVQLPDFVADKFGWIRGVRKLMEEDLTRRGVGSAYSQSRVLNLALSDAGSKSALGDLQKVWDLYEKAFLKHLKENNLNLSDEKAVIFYCESIGLTPEQTAQVQKQSSGPHGYAERAFYFDYADKLRCQSHPEAVEAAGKGFYETGFVSDTSGSEEVQRKYYAAQSEADEAFGQKKKRRPVVNPGNWTHDDSKRNRFYGELAEKGWNKYGIRPIYKSRIIHNALEVKSIHETHLSPKDAEIRVLAYLEKLVREKDPMAAAETTIHRDAWLKFLEDNNWTREEVLEAINAALAAQKKEPVKSLTEWTGNLTQAAAIMRGRSGKPQQNGSPKQPPARRTAQPEPQPTWPAPVAIDRNLLPRTLTGISMLDISAEMNRRLEGGSDTYKPIKFGLMSGKTDVDGDRVRDRFDAIFGPMGWRIVPNAVAGRVEHEIDLREKKDNNGNTVTDVWHVCTLVAHQFQYMLVMPDGSVGWQEGQVTSDLHDNLDWQYAYRGAMTSLLKQFYRLMGGMNHVIYSEYTHREAAAEGKS